MIIFTADDGLLPEFVPCLSENNSINCVLFPFDKVLKTLKSLPSKCSKTPDGFPTFSIKSSPAIAFSLSLLFEMSMSTGHIPLVWTTAFVQYVLSLKRVHVNSPCIVTIDQSHKRVSFVKLWKVLYHLL